MLICQETDAENYYNIIDTKDKELDIDEIDDYVKHYTKDEVAELLKTNHILGLDKNEEDFINKSTQSPVMYIVDNSYYTFDFWGNRQYIAIYNLDYVFIIDVKADMLLSDSIETIDYLDIRYINIEQTRVSLTYEIPQLDAVGQVDYAIVESGIAIINDKLDIESYLGDEITVDLPIRHLEAEALLKDLGIDADLSDDFYDLCEACLCMEFIDSNDTLYLISKDAVYRYKEGITFPKAIYQKKELD